MAALGSSDQQATGTDAVAYRGISTYVFNDDGQTSFASYEGMFDPAAQAAAIEPWSTCGGPCVIKPTTSRGTRMNRIAIIVGLGCS